MKLPKREEALLELQDKSAGIHRKDHSKENFIAFFERNTMERFELKGNYGNWDASLKHFKKCFGEILPMKEVDLEMASRFRNYLEFKAKTKSDNPLSQNSRHAYFNKFKACLSQAYRERVINDNIADYVRGFKQGETTRGYLTFAEVESLARRECRYPMMKRAFLFSCFTGMRWSDIQKLIWKDIRHSEKRGYEVVFKQKKTGGQEYFTHVRNSG
ncbi:MAG: site-specific integrase [Crocinitomicaceae bacterium]|nr:site-specific integrase [Crocinitomicaceae bacterium]